MIIVTKLVAFIFLIQGSFVTTLGEPIFLITFGSGIDQFSKKTPADFGFTTTEKQLYNPSVKDGTFSFVNRVMNFDNKWHTDALDHTPNDTDGYMFVSSIKGKNSEIFNTTVNGLNIGYKYEFSAYLANIMKQTSSYVKPNVRFVIRSENQLLDQFSTGPIPEYSSMTWKKYGFTFISSSRSVTLLLISDVKGDGNDLAMDDIEFRSLPSGFCFSGSNNPTMTSSVFLITFGSGPDLNSTKVPNNFGFSVSSKQFPVFIHTIPKEYSQLHTQTPDHTPNDINGYMYFLDIQGANSELFRYTITDLCIGYTYIFSAYFANMVKYSNAVLPPNIRFEVRSATDENQLIAQMNTSDISQTEQITWIQHGLQFDAITSSVVLLMISNHQGVEGNDPAIDDIELRMCSSGRSKFCYPNKISTEPIITNPDFIMTFGFGNETYSRTTPFDLNFRTAYQQSSVDGGGSGTFKLVNILSNYVTAWFVGELDHTPNDIGGYMLLFDANESDSECFDMIFHNLSIGIRYEIIIYVANIHRKLQGSIVKPNLLFQIRTATLDNYLLVEFETGEIDTSDQLTWFKYSLSFLVSSNAVVLLIFSNANAPSGIGNDFVIDDIELHISSAPVISLFPNTTSISSPLQIYQTQNLHIIADIPLDSTQSAITYQWTMFNRSLSSPIQIPLKTNNKQKEILFRSENLTFDIYEVRCTIIIRNHTSTFISTASVYIKIVPSYFIVHLLSLNRLNITHYYQHDLVLNPAKYTIAPNRLIFYPHKWFYKYYYRLYNSMNIENFQLLNEKNFSQTSLRIPSQFFQPNEIYQFLVHMIHHNDSSLQFIGYVFVNIRDVLTRTISIECSMSSICSPIPGFQYLNQHTELILISECFDNCSSIVNISWMISNQISSYSFNNKLRISSDFFENHSDWQFDVFYSFQNQIRINNTIHIKINKAPENGSCSIHPLNGTIDTLFTISCSNWIDSNGIKDYSFYGVIENSTKRYPLGSTSNSTYELQFPPAFNYQLIIHIRDIYGSITEFNISSITIFNNLTDSWIDSIEKPTKQNILQQILNILNGLNKKHLHTLIENKFSPSTISVSSLSSHPSNLSNTDIPFEFYEHLNKHAAIRERLIIYINDLSLESIDDLLFLSSILADLTQTTNELTRKTSILATNKCQQLSQIFEHLSSKIPMKDMQTISTYLLECAANIMTAINGPLQGRMKVLDLDMNQIDNTNDQCQSSYLSDDGKRNLCVQKQTADFIRNEMNELILLITTSLIFHENILIDTDFVYFSIDSMANSSVLLQSMIEPLAFVGDFQTEIITNFSRSISLSLFNEYGQVIPWNTTFDNPIEIFIPRDPNLIIGQMFEQHVTQKSILFNYHMYYLKRNYAIHFELHSMNENISYLLTYQLDSSNINGWTYFCSTERDETFVFYLDNNQTSNYQTVTFAIRELNTQEVDQYCQNKTMDLFIVKSPMKFSTNYEIRSYLSACFYLNQQNTWQSDGLLVGRLTNHSHTHCLSTHV